MERQLRLNYGSGGEFLIDPPASQGDLFTSFFTEFEKSGTHWL
jgi:hypothetical protein